MVRGPTPNKTVKMRAGVCHTEPVSDRCAVSMKGVEMSDDGTGGGRKDANALAEAAELGDAQAQFELGLMHDEGRGVRQDDVEAAKWYLRAAGQGHADAQIALALMYYNGWGVPKDEGATEKWLRSASEQGHKQAQYRLGLMYERGLGVPQDISEAVKWYRKSAEQGYVNAIEKYEALKNEV